MDNGDFAVGTVDCPAEDCDEVVAPTPMPRVGFLSLTMEPAAFASSITPWCGINSSDMPSYGSSFWTDGTAQGSANDFTSSFKSELYDELPFTELLYVVTDLNNTSDVLISKAVFASELSSLFDAFQGNELASEWINIQGEVSQHGTGGTDVAGFNISCSSYGGGSVRFGLGSGKTCNIFYGFGCSGGTYCGVPDFHASWMASNTNRLYPSGNTHDTFGERIELWVR